jgi:copper(I)-binding protein
MRSSTSSSPDRGIPARLAAAAALLLGLALAACGPGAATTPPTGTAPAVSGAWVRPPQGMDRPAAGYLVITGGSQADALISAKSAIAGSVEIHETSMDSSGMTGMHPISRLEVPAGATVTLQPGGYHLMFMELTGTVEVGAKVQIELTFEKAGTITVEAEVRQG